VLVRRSTGEAVQVEHQVVKEPIHTLTIAPRSDGFGQYLQWREIYERGGIMHARVATFQHDSPESVDKMLESMQSESESGPPPGLEDAKGVGIIFFEDEAALKRGDEALNNMSPPADAGAKRASVDFYEVPIKDLS
jgi:hypothetical protein